MAIKLVQLKKKNGDILHAETEAGLVLRGASTVDADLTIVEATANAAIPGSAKGAANGVAQLGADGKVPASQLPSQALTKADISVEDITALLALDTDDAPLNIDVFVGDASGDSTVEAGWALYRRIALVGETLEDWTKFAEGEGLDVEFVDSEARADIEALGGTAYYVASGADLSGFGDNDLIFEELPSGD